MTDNTNKVEITSDDDSQSVLTAVLGDIDDVESNIDDQNYQDAVEQIDEILEKLTAVRVYLQGVVDNG